MLAYSRLRLCLTTCAARPARLFREHLLSQHVLDDAERLVLPAHGLLDLRQVLGQIVDFARVKLDAVFGGLFDVEARAYVDEDGG